MIRSPIRHRSKKKARELRAFNKSVPPAKEWRPCEGKISAHCTGFGTERHHVIPQSQGGADVRANIKYLCPACHAWVKNFPNQARLVGLLKSNSAHIAPSPLLAMAKEGT